MSCIENNHFKYAQQFVKSVSKTQRVIDIYDVKKYDLSFLPDILYKVYTMVSNDEYSDVVYFSFQIRPRCHGHLQRCMALSFVMLGGKVHPYDVVVDLEEYEFVKCVAQFFRHCPDATYMDTHHDEDVSLTFKDIAKILSSNQEIFPHTREFDRPW